MKIFKSIINIVLTLIIVICAYKIIHQLKEYNDADKVYNLIREEKEESDNLFEKNIDYRGWIKIDNTNINYPILQGQDNEEYLYKDINKDYTPLGSLFSFSGTNFTKGNTFIFGHNMANNQMFGELRKYIDLDFLKEHRYLYVYTERKAMKCDIFSIFVTNENDEIFNGEYELGTVEYVSLIEELNKRNKYSEYSLEESSINYSIKQIFNLITCYGREGTTERLVVNAIVEEEKIR